MNNIDNNDKLEWMYKGANSQVDREEYLLGKTVDKTFEQLNNEEKEKKLGLVPPKNHVEHECIPPSIRDYNRIIVHQEQVDLSAKLQEDPLIAIKKQEDEARRQFLQNPIQLKKLQDALKAQESKKKKKKKGKRKHSDSEDDLDKQIREKLKTIKGSSLASSFKRKDKNDSKARHLDTILMHKYNQLKDKLSQKDLDDILAGRSSSDGEEESAKIKKESDESSYDSDIPRKKPHLENTRNKSVKDKYSNFKNDKRRYTKERDSSVSSNSDSKEKRVLSKYVEKNKRYQESRRGEYHAGGSTDYRKSNKGRGYRESRSESPSERSHRKNKKHLESSKKNHSESSDDSRREKRKDKKYREKRESGSEDRRKAMDSGSRSTRNDDGGRSRSEERKKLKKAEQKDSRKTDQDLDTLILQKLRILRDSKTDKYKHKEDTPEKEYAQYDSDDDYYVVRKKSFGLVRSDGTKIPLKDPIPAPTRAVKKVQVKPAEVKKTGTKLGDKEKEELRRQMMADAVKRDKERSDNLRKHREENEREEKMDDFDKNFVHKELSKSHTNIKSVETRIRSKLNNIQRSSQHMNSNFAKRS